LILTNNFVSVKWFKPDVTITSQLFCF